MPGPDEYEAWLRLQKKEADAELLRNQDTGLFDHQLVLRAREIERAQGLITQQLNEEGKRSDPVDPEAVLEQFRLIAESLKTDIEG